jgi:beta-glucosidase
MGAAIADALFGRTSPSGKIAETFPLALEDAPGFPNWAGERGSVVYGEGVFIGYRWYDTLHRAVRYPFGHGLSYTAFAYDDLEVEVRDAMAGLVRVSCRVANTGARGGSEVVQLYVGDPDAEVDRPLRELRGFDKVRLEPGESVRVVFELESRDFAYWDSATRRGDGRAGLWRREGGEFAIEVGASSRDIRLAATISLPDDPDVPPLVPDARLLEVSASRFVDGHAG